MSEINLDELRALYEEELADKVRDNYTPFAMKYSNPYDVGNGVLFVGKAENMESNDGFTIEEAFSNPHKGLKEKNFVKKLSKEVRKSAYSRVTDKLTKFFYYKGIISFARTNLYKLSNTQSPACKSKPEKAYHEILKKEIEILQPKYVIMLTSGHEKEFIKYLGKKISVDNEVFTYPRKGKEQAKEIKCFQIEGFDSYFITALHPQGKPEDELVEVIKSLIEKTE